jgi:hypothetical protein
MRLRPLACVAVALIAACSLTALAGAEIVQKGGVRVAVTGDLSPKRLPRSGSAPVRVSVGGEITATDKGEPPKLKTLTIELNRNGRLDVAGLPVCPYDSIQTASTARALAACREALVGRGSFTAEISLAGQEPYSTTGTMLAFNGREHGQPVLFGQIYSPRPFATSFVIVFAIGKAGKGAYGTTLTAQLPASLRSWGNLTGIELRLARTYVAGGRRHSYISAGCPAPKGLSKVSFPFARTSFGFQGGPALSSVLIRSCRAHG